MWSALSLSFERLNSYRPKNQQVESSSYSIDSYTYLARELIKSLFKGFQKIVLALDPSVEKEILKLYIIYKEEGNFVCVILKAKQFDLSFGLKNP